jgi:hypothetical protein
MPFSDDDPVTKWVAEVNRMAREMDEVLYTTHPSGWPEILASDYEQRRLKRFKALCRKGPTE